MLELFPSPDEPNQPSIVSGREAADAASLEMFGFDYELICEVLDAAHSRSGRATKASAKAQRGSDFFFAMVEHLRLKLIPKGFTSVNDTNIEMVRSPKNTFQIATGQGDKATGNVNKPAGTKNPKGPATTHLVENNQGGFDSITPHPSWDAIKTWWLLYRVTPSDDDMRFIYSEISLPVSHAGKSFVWSKRIILPPYQLGKIQDPPQEPPSVDVPVARRG